MVLLDAVATLVYYENEYEYDVEYDVENEDGVDHVHGRDHVWRKAHDWQQHTFSCGNNTHKVCILFQR